MFFVNQTVLHSTLEICHARLVCRGKHILEDLLAFELLMVFACCRPRHREIQVQNLMREGCRVKTIF